MTKTYTLHDKELPYYYSLWDTLWAISWFCSWWYLEDEHPKLTYTCGTYTWEIPYWNFSSAEEELDYKPKYKFINAKAKRLIESKYVKFVVGNNYAIDPSDLPKICKEYLELTNQR